MTNRSPHPAPRSFPRGRLAIIIAAALAVALILLPRYAPDYAPFSSDTPGRDSAEAHDTKITRLDEASAPRIHPRDSSLGDLARSNKARPATSATRALNPATTDTQTSVPLQQEAYLAAMTAMMEKDGRDNALVHYALAFELAPDRPTDEQAALIKLVMEEGWDERAMPLLPYLLAWQAAFEKLHHGASVKYARGIGVEQGANTPVPNYLKAQNASKMLAVYSRYLASQGRAAEGLQQINTALSMGRDFNSPDNLIISNLVGTAIENVALRQISHLISTNALSPSQLASTLDHLQYIEQGQPHPQSVIDAEMQASLTSIRKIIENPEAFRDENNPNPEIAHTSDGTEISMEQYEEQYRKLWAALSEKFDTPYWERGPGYVSAAEEEIEKTFPVPTVNFFEAEVRFLATTSKLRQQQINIAAQRYIANFQKPPPDINTLVNQNYLPANPVDPFSGNPFTYAPTTDGYQLYGSGPNINSPNNPIEDWNPVNGTISPGVIRTR